MDTSVYGYLINIDAITAKQNEKLRPSFCFALNLHYVEGFALEITRHLGKTIKQVCCFALGLHYFLTFRLDYHQDLLTLP